VAVDAAGNVYVADTGNNTIRKINTFGLVTTLAGTAGKSGNVDGLSTNATFSNLQSLAVGDQGNIYVLDGNAIRKITPTGAVTTLPHFSIQHSAFSISFHPTGIAADGTGDLFLVDAMNDVIWQATPPKP
jgi:DNA-binding beta-propeller fold protein YncE